LSECVESTFIVDACLERQYLEPLSNGSAEAGMAVWLDGQDKIDTAPPNSKKPLTSTADKMKRRSRPPSMFGRDASDPSRDVDRCRGRDVL
jgi:hypothetical protein